MFQTRLRELREAAGYKSQQAFADAFGVAQSTVGNWEAGKREPNYDTTIRLAQFFGVAVGDLMGVEPQNDAKKEPPAQGGEPVGPNKRALLDLVDDMSEEEMTALLELVKATKKMRDGK